MKRFFVLLLALSFSGLLGSVRTTASALTLAVPVPVVDSTASATSAASVDSTVSTASTASADTLWAAANTAYSNGDYARAVEAYTAITAQGRHSAKLYYNLGNSWYKQNRLGKAILHYNKALLLDPADEDTRYNLAMANARMVDKIDTVPEFFLKTWLREVAVQLNSNVWAVTGLVFLLFTLAGVLLWLLSNTLNVRKLGFYGGLLCLLLCLSTLCFAQYQRARIVHDREAIVMNLVAPVKSSPGTGSKDLFVLHEGTKVRVLERLDGWAEILLSDGNKGWILASAIEPISFEK